MQVLNRQTGRHGLPLMVGTLKDQATANGRTKQDNLNKAVAYAPIALLGAATFVIAGVVALVREIRRGGLDIRKMIRQANL